MVETRCLKVGKPSEFSTVEKADFAALVLAGGEVTPEGLPDRIERAAFLIQITLNGCLAGVAAIKHPYNAYRKNAFQKSGTDLVDATFPFEFGWAFVMPSARSTGLSKDLLKSALTEIGDKSIFATSRSDNTRMHKTLKKYEFQQAGEPYSSERGDYKLTLFVKSGAK